MPPPAVVLALAYLAGSIPVANLAARLAKGVDLRSSGTGKVSGSALYEVAGFGPLAVAGCAELAKGAVGPLLAGRRRPLLAAGAASVGIIGHDWSPWIGFRGGRGVSLVIGAGMAMAPEAAAVVGAGLGLGRLVRQSGVGTLLGLAALPPLLARTRPPHGALAGFLLVAPVVAKRILGEGTSPTGGAAGVLERLLADRERRPRSGADQAGRA